MVKVILAAEKKALVFGGPGIVNDDYEGEISGPGTTVHITQFGDPIISAYAPNESITYQELDDAGQELLIDQRYYFGFTIDDVDKRQAAGDMQCLPGRPGGVQAGRHRRPVHRGPLHRVRVRRTSWRPP